MSRKYKLLTMVFMAMLLALPASLRVVQANDAAILGLSTNTDTIDQGRTVTFTIETTNAANYVFVGFDSKFEHAAFQMTDNSGSKIWTVTFAPEESQLVIAYANTTNSVDGANTTGVNINVVPDATGATGTTGGGQLPPPSSSSASNDVVAIYDANSDKMDFSRGERVTYTVLTNIQVNFVWIRYDNDRYMRATLTDTTNEQKTWSVTISPGSSQTVEISANTQYIVRGSVSVYKVLTEVEAPVVIVQARSNRTTISRGNSLTITVRTNNSAGAVWVVSDDEVFDARRTNTSRNERTWSVTISPDRSQRIAVFAGYDVNDPNPVSTTVSITVSTPSPPVSSIPSPARNAMITNARADWANYSGSWYNFNNDSIRITVTTNSSAQFVWASAGYGNFSLSHTSSDVFGNKTWTGTTRASSFYYYDSFFNLPSNYWNWNWNWGSNWWPGDYYYHGDITVYAGTSSGRSDDSRRIYLESYFWGGNIGGFIASPGSAIAGIGTIGFSITTDAWVSSVRIYDHTGSVSISASRTSVAGGSQLWYAKWDVPANETPVVNKTIFATAYYPNNVPAETRSTSVTILAN